MVAWGCTTQNYHFTFSHLGIKQNNMHQNLKTVVDSHEFETKIKEIVSQAIQDQINNLRISLLKDDSIYSLLSRKEVSELLKIHVNTLDKIVKSGKLPSQKIGVNVFFSRYDIRVYLFLTNFRKRIGEMMND
jgi:excisionase family DNA binding protein